MRNVEQAQRSTFRPAPACFPRLYELSTHIQTARENRLRRIQAFPHRTNVVGAHGRWRGRKYCRAEIPLPTSVFECLTC